MASSRAEMSAMEIRRRSDFNWDGMMKWWSADLDDGTHSSEEENLEYMEESSDDDPYCYDVVERVHNIGISFLRNTEDLKRILFEKETIDDGIAAFLAELVELQELAEYVDITKELYIDNYLAPLFHRVLSYKCDAGICNKYAAVRTMAAEVVSTMVHNNPTNQQLAMEVNGLQHLLDNFISDPDVTARTKALVAISSLIRNNKPGITAFRKENGGYAALRDALSSESVTLQREALNLIQYLLQENSSDCNIVTELGFPRIMMHLASNDDAEVREAALGCLLVLERVEEGGNSGQLVKNDDKLKQDLQEQIEGISAMALEDLGVAREERHLVDSLWNACYNEPSSLRENGLLVLPGEDAPAPDVARKQAI